MERAIVHADLKKEEIQPQKMLNKYIALLEKDIKNMLPMKSLDNVSGTTIFEHDVLESFTKMGMIYNVGSSFGNIYLSPRPSMDTLKLFYQNSTAREYWLTKLWVKTSNARQKKIILPTLEWARGFISEYIGLGQMQLAEFIPNHWGYLKVARDLFKVSEYRLVEPLFNLPIMDESIPAANVLDQPANNSLDVAFLFEALDRSPSPLILLNDVKNVIKPGGLCFITCLLSSGFEIQIMGKDSGVFVPPERMNIFSFEGMNELISEVGGFDIIEYSTPGVLDVANVVKSHNITNSRFFHYIFKQRNDKEIFNTFQDFLQINRLGTFGRLVLRKK